MIPKIIHQMWIGEPMPEYMEVCRQTWRDHHPDWDFMDWSDYEQHYTGWWKNEDLVARAHEISPGAPYQFISDVVRYEVLHEHGGVWIDMDMECQKPIDDLLHADVDPSGICDGDEPEAFMAWEVPGRWLNNAIMGAEKGSPFLRQAILQLPGNVRRRGLRRANTVLSGPQFITPIARAFLVTTYPKEWFYPYLWNELDRMGESFPDAYAIHHWNNRRKRLDV